MKTQHKHPEETKYYQIYLDGKWHTVAITDRKLVNIVNSHEELLEACKEAKMVIYNAINKRKVNLSLTWHSLEKAIALAEGRE